MEDFIQYIMPWLINILRYFIIAGIPFLVFYICFPKVFSKNRIQKRLAKKKDFLREIGHSIQTTIVLAVVFILFIYSPLRAYTQIYDGLTSYSIWWFLLSILLALVVHDSYFYWMHKTIHHPKIYKKVHLIHHKSINPSPWASYSFHFYEAILEALVAPFIVFLIPMHPFALFIFAFIAFGINVYGHLGYEIAPKWLRNSILFEWVTTSVYHNLHHSKFDGNYGLYFRFWDRSMGTENPDYVREYDKIQVKRFGSDKKRSHLKNSVATGLFFLLLGMGKTTAQDSILGIWKDDTKGVTMELFEENGKIYGNLIAADSKKINEQIKEAKNTTLLKNFQKKDTGSYCCGTIYQPQIKKEVSATLTLHGTDSLKINATYMGIKRTRFWKRLY